MMRPFGRNPALASIIGLGIVNHIVLAGSRVTVTLDALRQGTSTAAVGVLLALFALLPALFSVAAGRLSDRIGVRQPMIAGSLILAAGAVLPLLFKGLPGLFVSAALMGVGFMLFQVPAQNATGEVGPPTERARNFSTLALGYAFSGLLGPLVAGLSIDHAGFAPTFAIFALLPLVPAVVLARGRPALPAPHPAAREASRGGALALLTHRKLRRVFLVNVLLSMAWDLNTIVIPVYGNSIGLTASQIGVILACFGAATVVVRFSMPRILRHANEHQVLTIALLIAGTVYMLFPFSHSAPALMVLCFCLGLGLGMSQPMVMSLLHTHAPAGRMGEAAGVRMSLVQAIAVGVPLTFGTLGATVGLTPVFWSVGLLLAGSGIFSKPPRG